MSRLAVFKMRKVKFEVEILPPVSFLKDPVQLQQVQIFK